MTGSTNTTHPAEGIAAAIPSNLPGLLSLLLSFSALRDWVKLFVIGGAIETSRRCLMMAWSAFLESFWLTACFDDNDMSYSEFICAIEPLEVCSCVISLDWILFWLSKNSTWSEPVCAIAVSQC